MIWFYRLLYLPVLLIALPYYGLRMWRRGGYRKGFQHRFGWFHRIGPVTENKTRIWLQAVSVGEVLAIRSLLEALKKDTSIEIVLTTTTSTGYAEARKHYAEKVACIGIFPLDFWLFSQIAWNRIRPDLIILMESELWPEHLHQAEKRNIPAFLVNARISDRSFRRYQRVPALCRYLLKKFCMIYAAGEPEKSRLTALGCPAGQIRSSGNIKFDVVIGDPVKQEESDRIRKELGFTGDSHRPFVLLGSSTWPGEEIALLKTQKVLVERGIDCRLLLVPRHAERRTELVPVLKAQAYPWHQRSTGKVFSENPRIYLADTTGELTRLSQAADLAFIGKSLPPNLGGQTPIEAAALGIPILMGPNMNNFRDIARSLVETGAAKFVENSDTLTQTVLELAENTRKLRPMQEVGIHWHRSNRGSSQGIAESILKFKPERCKRVR